MAFDKSILYIGIWSKIIKLIIFKICSNYYHIKIIKVVI